MEKKRVTKLNQLRMELKCTETNEDIGAGNNTKIRKGQHG